MSYGMTVNNLSGFVQVAEPFDNVSVFTTGTTTTQSPSTGLTWTNLPSSTPDDILIFAKPATVSGVYKFAMQLDRTGGTTPRFYFYDSTSSTGQSVDYVVLTKSQALTVPASGYGLNVYNSSGNLAFTSEYGTSRVYQSRVTTPSTSTFASVYSNVGGELLNNTWVCMNAFGFFGFVPNGPSYTSGLAYKVKFDFTNDEISSLVDPYSTIFFSLPTLINSSSRVEMLARF